VRISGFGRTIVTELDAPPMKGDSATFVYGAEETDRTFLYECRKVDSRAIDSLEDSSERIRGPGLRVQPGKFCTPCDRPLAVEKIESDEKVRERGRKMNNNEGVERVCSKFLDSRRFKFRSDFQSEKLLRLDRDSSELCGRPVILKVSGLFDNGAGEKKPTVTVAADSSGKTDELDHDIFVLRIGKKGLVGVGDKSDIQLEMKTPKGPEKRPPIRYETRDAQTDVEEKPWDVKKPREVKKKKKEKNHRV